MPIRIKSCLSEKYSNPSFLDAIKGVSNRVVTDQNNIFCIDNVSYLNDTIGMLRANNENSQGVCIVFFVKNYPHIKIRCNYRFDYNGNFKRGGIYPSSNRSNLDLDIMQYSKLAVPIVNIIEKELNNLLFC